MNNSYYPAGTENDPRAPWNETEQSPISVEVDYSCTIRRTATVETTDYISGEVDKEWDGEGYVVVRNDDDFSEVNWLEEFRDTYRTPLQLIDVLRTTAEELQQGKIPNKSQSFWRDIIADCKDWTLDDEEAETETT